MPNESPFQRFYTSSAWRKLRKAKLEADPLCEYCKEKTPSVITPASEVDHITPISIDYSLRLEWTNLKSACKSCHSAKTFSENKKPKPGRILNQRYSC